MELQVPGLARRARAMAAAGLALACACVPLAQAQPSGDGKAPPKDGYNRQGVLLGSFKQVELATRSTRVPKITVTLEVQYRWTTLMGEFLETYALRWAPISVMARSTDARGREVLTRLSASDAAISAAIEKVELSMEGETSLYTGQSDGGAVAGQVFHAFSTGPASRPRTLSWDVPGSPNWAQLWRRGAKPCSATAKGDYVSADAAKRIAKDVFGTAVAFVAFEGTCEQTVSNLDVVERALDAACRARQNKAPFCDATPAPGSAASAAKADPLADAKAQKAEQKPDPKAAGTIAAKVRDPFDNGQARPSSNAADALDDQAARPSVLKRLAQEKASYRKTAEPACRSTLGGIEVCFAGKGCTSPAGLPDTAQCNSIPIYPGSGFGLHLDVVKRPGDLCYVEDAACRASRAEEERRSEIRRQALREEQREWKSRYGALSDQCEASREARKQLAACRSAQQASCNPQRLDGMDACLDHMVSTRGPTEADAARLLNADRAKPAAKTSILD